MLLGSYKNACAGLGIDDYSPQIARPLSDSVENNQRTRSPKERLKLIVDKLNDGLKNLYLPLQREGQLSGAIVAYDDADVLISDELDEEDISFFFSHLRYSLGLRGIQCVFICAELPKLTLRFNDEAGFEHINLDSFSHDDCRNLIESTALRMGCSI